MKTVLITDYAWPDLSIETEAIKTAGFSMVSGPAVAASAEVIEELTAEYQPAAILTNWAQVSAKAIASSRNLKVVSRLGVGLDNIDVAACTQRGVWVTNVPDYCVEEVSDHAVGLLLAWARGLVTFDRSVKSGAWNPADARLRRVSELTVGIIGHGRIARRSIQKLKAWDSRILVCNRSPVNDGYVTQVPLMQLMAESDAVIVHVPFSSETQHLINEETLSAAKQGSFLINVSRGGVIDTSALLRALDTGRLSGAGLDVIEGEPTPPGKITAHPQVIVTPHIAFSSDASIRELRGRAVACALAALNGEAPPNACNLPVANVIATNT